MSDREWVIEDPTPEDLKMPDCSSVEPDATEGYDPENDDDNVDAGDESD